MSHTLARTMPLAPRRPAVRRTAPLSVTALAGIVATTVLTTLLVLAAALIGPFIMFALPFMLLFGFALGPLHALAKGELR